MSETTLRFLEIVFSAIVSLLCSAMTLYASYKLMNFRMQKQEEKTMELEHKHEETNGEVVDLKIAISTVEKDVQKHTGEIKEIKDEQKRLAQFHEKKE